MNDIPLQNKSMPIVLLVWMIWFFFRDHTENCMVVLRRKKQMNLKSYRNSVGEMLANKCTSDRKKSTISHPHKERQRRPTPMALEFAALLLQQYTKISLQSSILPVTVLWLLWTSLFPKDPWCKNGDAVKHLASDSHMLPLSIQPPILKLVSDLRGTITEVSPAEEDVLSCYARQKGHILPFRMPLFIKPICSPASFRNSEPHVGSDSGNN